MKSLRRCAFLFCLVWIKSASFASLSGQSLFDAQKIEIQPGRLGTVAIFLSTKCPCSKSHVDLIKELSKAHRDFSFVVVHSNVDEDISEAKTYFQSLGMGFPVLQDEQTKLADELKAYKTPHAFVLAPDGRVLYKGGVTSAAIATNANKQFLQEALLDIEAGKSVRRPEGRTLGCIISRDPKNVW